MGKVITTVYLDEHLVQLARLKKINFSKALETTLQQILGSHIKDRCEVEEKIAEYTSKLASLSIEKQRLDKEEYNKEIEEQGIEKIKKMNKESPLNDSQLAYWAMKLNIPIEKLKEELDG